EKSEQDGAIIAQGLVAAAVPHVTPASPAGLGEVIGQARRRLELATMSITDRDGRILASTEPGRVGHLDPTARSAFRSPTQPPSPTDLIVNQRVRLRARAPILRGTDVIGFVNVEFYSHTVAAHARRLARSGLLLAGVWILVGGLLATIYVRRITRPLRTLSDAVEELGEGRFDIEIPGRASNDEVGALARRFGQLAGRLSERDRELRDLNATLQQRVDAVTADLRGAKEFLSLVLESVGEGILTVDAAERITSANLGAFEIVGGAVPRAAPEADTAELAGRPFAALFRPDERALVSGLLARALSGQRAEPFDGTIERPDHRLVPVRVALAPLGAPPSGLVARLEDLTEWRRLEEQVRRSDRLASLGTLSAGFAHEMGNILHVINGYAKMILRDLPADAAVRGDAERIDKENRRGIELLDRFSVFARPQRAAVGRRDVRAILEEALDAIAPEARQRKVTVTRALPALPEVEGDGTLLRQAFFNVLLNGLQAVGREGTLTVSAGEGVGGMVRIEVRDTGCGIPEENLPRVFDPFFTTKEAEGTGLGLAIVHRIIEVHGGRVEIESEVGKGTLVRFVLPAAPAASRTAAAAGAGATTVADAGGAAGGGGG
ncbi:MAG: HAMP domain-containing protein, partial [Deltaproteobacteria bacterium]|nr:HAMP domain-containing protein [Deltaproteobacteria bacterium]